MKPAPFDYLAPHSLEEVLIALNNYGYDGKLLAGGQSLVPVMNYRLAQPSVIVDLNGVAGLSGLAEAAEGGLSIGAMVRHSTIENSTLVANRAPLISETMPYIAHPQIRNRGTLGGSLAHADPAAELPAIMVILDARFRVQRLDGERWVKAVDFYHSLFTTALEADELLVEISIPALPPDSGYAFKEVARRHGDYAQVGVAAVVRLDSRGVCKQARLVFLNVGEIPMVAAQAANLLVGEVVTPTLVAEAAALASLKEIDPTDDIHASAPFKRHLAEVLGRRALQEALDRAKSGTDI